MTLSLAVGDFTLSAAPALSTSPPPEHPDLGEGMEQARDRALDAEAVQFAHGEAPLPPQLDQAEADVDASIATVRAETDPSPTPIPIPVVDPLVAILGT